MHVLLSLKLLIYAKECVVYSGSFLCFVNVMHMQYSIKQKKCSFLHRNIPFCKAFMLSFCGTGRNRICIAMSWMEDADEFSESNPLMMKGRAK